MRIVSVSLPNLRRLLLVAVGTVAIVFGGCAGARTSTSTSTSPAMAKSPQRSTNICTKYGMQHGVFALEPRSRRIRLLWQVRGTTGIDKLHVSPDGKWTTYLACIRDIDNDCICDDREYFHKEVHISRLDGSDERVIAPSRGGFTDYPTWSPDGKRVNFMQSSAGNRVDAELYSYDLASTKTTQITATPRFMESDHWENTDGSMTVVRQAISHGKMIGPGNLVRVAPNHVAVTELFSESKNLGEHCCVADGKYSPTMSHLVFARLVAVRDGKADWDILLRARGGQDKDLSRGPEMDLWPMWRADGRQLLWVRWDERRSTYSVVIHRLHDAKQEKIVLIGEGVSHRLGTRKLIFARISWPTWLHPDDKEVIFPATYAVYNR